MCGINGILTYAGKADYQSAVLAMNKALEHRGPDADGLYSDDFISLGHRRLSIIDLSKDSNQPFNSSDQRYTLVFNGEIYNYKEVRAQLPDHNFSTNGDTEVVLAAYMKWGHHCLRMFNGMFGFAVWDNVRQELFIARDRLGIKPVYYYSSNEQFVFSSSLKSVLASELVKRELDTDALVDYLRYQTVHAPKTIVKDIKMLMPGEYMVINEEGVQTKKYWDITTDFQFFKGSDAEARQLVREELSKSVERRLVTDVPFGAFLSGGIDSSIIVAIMAGLHGSAVDTFSIVFKENEFTEAEFSRMIASQYQTNHHEIELSVEDFKEAIPQALKYMDHPSGDGPNTYVVSRETRKAGVKMALSGLGGDELFGGYRCFQQIPELQSKKWLKSFPAYFRKPMSSLYHGLKGTVESAKIKELLRLEYFDTEYIHQYYRQVLMDSQILTLLNRSTLPLSQSFSIAHELIGYRKSGWGLPPLSRISVAEISTYMQNVLLRDSDQMSMASALELRVPFLDHELVEKVLGIGDELKRPLTPKKLLVESFEDLIPQEIYNRPKMGFVLPYEQWMKNELREFCADRLNELKKLSDFNPAGIDRIWSQFLKGSPMVTWSRIWPLVVLGDWIKENQIER